MPELTTEQALAWLRAQRDVCADGKTWDAGGLSALLRYGRKNSGVWDDMSTGDDYVPDEGDVPAIMAARTGYPLTLDILAAVLERLAREIENADGYPSDLAGARMRFFREFIIVALEKGGVA